MPRTRSAGPRVDEESREKTKGSFNMADVVNVAAGEPSPLMCLHMDTLASLSFSGTASRAGGGWMDGWVGVCSAGWQGAAAAAVTARGHRRAPQRRGKGKTDVDNQVFSSLSGWREEGSEMHIFG